MQEAVHWSVCSFAGRKILKCGLADFWGWFQVGGLFYSVCLAGNNKLFPQGLEDSDLLLLCRPFSQDTIPCFLSFLENDTFMDLCSEKNKKLLHRVLQACVFSLANKAHQIYWFVSAYWCIAEMYEKVMLPKCSCSKL